MKLLKINSITSKLIIAMLFLTLFQLNAKTSITHNFEEIKFKSHDWELKTSGSYWSTLYSSALTDSELHFRNKYGGESYINKGAYIWNAPEGQIIVGVEFRGQVAGYLNTFNAAVFSSSSKTTTLDNYTIEWSKYSAVAGPWHSENRSLQFDQNRGLKSLGFGFSDVQSDNTHQVKFTDIIIHTVPDVEILASIYRHNFINNPINSNDWIYRQGGSYSNILYKGELYEDHIKIKNIYGGEGYSNRCAYRWDAPNAEFITRITFHAEIKGYRKEFNIALFTNTIKHQVIEGYDVKWAKQSPSAGPWHGETVTFEFLPQENIQSIALGLFDTYSDNTHEVRFSNIIIETQSTSEATFDYSDGDIKQSNDWKLKTSGSFWGTLYNNSISSTEITFKNKYGGESYSNCGAYVWDAPANAYITGIRFKGEVAGYLDQFNATLFTSKNKNSTIDTYKTVWQKKSTIPGPWHSQYVYLTFSKDSLIKSIGLGFKDTQSDPTHQVKFSDITIITSPITPSTSVSRGWDIIRSKGFNLDSYVDLDSTVDYNKYQSFGLNGINFRLGMDENTVYGDFWTVNSEKTFGSAHYNNLLWTWFQNYDGGEYLKIAERADELNSRFGSTAYGYCIGDEYMFSQNVYSDYFALHHDQVNLNSENTFHNPYKVITPLKDVFPESDTLIQLGKLLKQIKSTNNNHLVYTVAAPMAMKYDARYNYKAYLDRVIDNVKPDILNYDHYPFQNNKLDDYFYINLSIIREKAIERGIPYSSWIQAFGTNNNDSIIHLSESELRFQAFVCLTYGYSLLSYWTYHSLDKKHKTSILYYKIDTVYYESTVGTMLKNITPEIKILGNELINMNSENIIYIPALDGLTLDQNTTDSPLTDPRIQSVSNNVNVYGFVLGFFNKSKDNSKYFMITNTKCSNTLTSEEAIQSITIKFKSDINSLQKLNRITGNWETVSLNNNTLYNYSIPGGTGELFRLPY